MDWDYLYRRTLLPPSFQPTKELLYKHSLSPCKEENGYCLRGEEEMVLIRQEPSYQSWFELLVYYCYAREKYPLVSKASLYFPLYSKMITYDLSGWKKEVEFRRDYNYFFFQGEIEKRPLLEEYGYHFPKEKIMNGELKSFSLPQQIFLTSPQGKRKIKQEDLEKIKEKKGFSPLFVHGRYIYNLCNRKDTWIVEGIKEELRAAEFIGALGVVVHMGKRNVGKDKLTWEEGIEAMEKNIREVVEEKFSVPLILETCAKQGTEMLGDVEEFLDFYSRLDRERVKICLDSCHVFAAGYDPLQFLQRIEEKFPRSTLLVHFNDSKGERGCHVDRHETPGLGYIGFKRMKALYDYCQEKRVPLVHE